MMKLLALIFNKSFSVCCFFWTFVLSFLFFFTPHHFFLSCARFCIWWKENQFFLNYQIDLVAQELFSQINITDIRLISRSSIAIQHEKNLHTHTHTETDKHLSDSTKGSDHFKHSSIQHHHQQQQQRKENCATRVYGLINSVAIAMNFPTPMNHEL